MSDRKILNRRGPNVIHSAWRTELLERGLAGPPNDFNQVRGNPSTEIDYEQYCALLEQAGINWLRIKLTGWNNPLGSRSASFEPPPAGTFNLWQSALNPGNLAQYRADQVSLPIPADVLQRSNIGQFSEAAQRHGVGFDVILFDNREFRDAWIRHAWNVNNQYISGQRCEPIDRGFMENALDAFTHPEAVLAAKKRVDAAIAMFSGYDVVTSWELMAEQTWLARPKDWGMTWGDARHRKLIEDLRNWNEMLAQYIHERHPAPVGVSVALPADVRQNTIRAELFDAPSLNWLGANGYNDTPTPKELHAWLRDAQARYPEKQIIFQQYHPRGDRTVPNETPPWKESKQFEWTAACGEQGFVAALRWPDVQIATYASPWLREIAGVTAGMGAVIAEGSWDYQGEPWDGKISTWASSWGNGRYVTAFMRPGSGLQQVTVSGLEGSVCTIREYDYLTGEARPVKIVPIAGGNAVFDVEGRDGYAAVFIEPEDEVPPDPPDPPEGIRTLYVRATLRIDGAADGVFEGTLEEVDA